MQPQKLCLKWNNHTANLLSVLGGFQQRDILVDVTISCEGQNIKAHKMVLSACSPFFQNIFLENPCQHPVVVITGIKYEDITAILNFMYKGEVNVSQDGLTSFLQAAEALKVKGLAEVCGEKRSVNSSNQDVQHNEQPTQNRPQRTETPPRKRHRNRKRSLSDSNRSDDEGSSRKQGHREPSSPEVHELSGDESFTGDTNSNGPPFNSTPRVPQNVYSRSHQSSSNMTEDDEEFEVEPSKLLEQTLTTDSVSINNSSVDNKLRIERIMGNAEMESSNIQEPESPPDIKPIIDYGDSSAGPSEGTMMLYNEQSQPGPSSLQDGTLLHDNAHTQDHCKLLKVVLANFQKEVYFKLDKIMAKIIAVDDRLEEQDNEKKIAQPLPIEEEGFLPVKSLHDLQDIESKLHESSYFVMLVNTLKGIGGSDVYAITTGILKRLLGNEVAELFSWAGAKKKLPFKDLILFKVILETVRFHRPLVTEAEISELVARWLVHAKLRREREEEKKMRQIKTI